jgi:hypothetical protein
MLKSEEIVRIRRGKAYTVRVDVIAWRRKMRRYNRLKAEILGVLASLNWSPEQVRAWSDTPVPELRNRPPKDLFEPKSIQVLYRWLKKTLRTYSTL